jgi:hypothetical protein
VTATLSRPSLIRHIATGRHGMTARIGAVGGRLSGRIHAAANDRARVLGWEVTETPGRFGLSSRSYRDPRFAARRQALQDTAQDGTRL